MELTKAEVKFVIEEVFSDFFEYALGKNDCGNYDKEAKQLDVIEKKLIALVYS